LLSHNFWASQPWFRPTNITIATLIIAAIRDLHHFYHENLFYPPESPIDSDKMAFFEGKP
jgi:hypothetical protein